MATAQDKFSLKCDLCDSERDIKWKCQDCEEWLCFNCKIAHTKSKATKGHKVISLADADVAEQQQIKSKLCNDHPDEPYHMYCKDCQQSICLRCITGEHRSHDFLKISDIVDEKKKELFDLLDSVKTKQLAVSEKSVKQLKKNQNDYDDGIDECERTLEKQKEELIEIIGQTVETAKSELERRARDDRKLMKEMEAEYTSHLSDLRDFIKTIEEKIESTGDIEIINLVTEVKKKLQECEKIVPVINVPPPVLICNKPDEKVMKQQFGHFDFEEEDERASEYVTATVPAAPVQQKKVKIISKFQHSFSASQIVCMSNNQGWIEGKQILALVTNNGKVQRTIHFKTDIYGLAVIGNETLLTSQVNEKKLKILNLRESDLKNFYDKCTINTVSDISVTPSGDIILCALSEVIILSSTGKMKQKIVFERGDYSGVKKVDYVTQNINGDIWITSVSSSCLVVCQNNGKFRFLYKGPSDTKMEKEFRPRKTICNKDGQVLIVDINNDNVHLVDKDGNFLQFLLTKEHGLNGPETISQDQDGKIWVGCADRKTVVVAKYL